MLTYMFSFQPSQFTMKKIPLITNNTGSFFRKKGPWISNNRIMVNKIEWLKFPVDRMYNVRNNLAN
jgi:hypothetical protein